MYPELFNHLKEKLERLPGVGKKTAERYAFAILGMKKMSKTSVIFFQGLKVILNHVQDVVF